MRILSADVAPSDRDAELPETDLERERASLLAAFRRTAGERGYRSLTIDAVTRGAGLPRERFDAHFPSKEEALIAAQGEFLDRLQEQVEGSCRGELSWPEQVAAGLHTILSNIGEAEGLARAFAVEATGESFAAAQRQFEAIDYYAAMLRSGRHLYPRSAPLPETTERMVVGGVASIIAEALLSEETIHLRDLEPQLLELLLAPYLGLERARRASGR